MSHNRETFADTAEVAALLGLDGPAALYKGTATRCRLDELGMPQPMPYRKRNKLWLRDSVVSFRDRTLRQLTDGTAPTGPVLVHDASHWGKAVADRTRESLR